MFKKMCFLTILIFIFLAGMSYGAVITESEPNNAPEKANAISAGDTARGQINYGDGYDYYKLTLLSRALQPLIFLAILRTAVSR